MSRSSLLIFLPFLLLSLTRSYQLSNRDAVGLVMRDKLLKLAAFIRPYKQETLQEMWKFAYSGFNKQIFDLAQYTDSPQRSKLKELVYDWEKALSECVEIMNLPKPPDEIMTVDTDQLQALRIDIEEKKSQVNLIDQDIKDQVGTLKSEQNQEWYENYEKYETIESIAAEFNLGMDDASAVEEFLEKVLECLPKSKQLIIKINNLSTEYQLRDPIQSVVESINPIRSFIGPGYVEDLDKLQKEITKIDKKIISLKEDIKNKFKAILDEFKKKLKKNSDYKDFENSMKKTRKLEENIKDQKILTREEAMKVKQEYATQMIQSWRRTRIPSGKIIQIKEEIKNLENPSINSSEMEHTIENNAFNGKSYYDTLKDLYENKEIFLVHLETKAQLKTNQLKKLEIFHSLSIQMDVELARLIAILVNGGDTSGIVYFAPEELSVLIYYMSLSKIIYSQEKFIMSLFVFLKEAACLNVLNRMRQDVLDVENLSKLPQNSYCYKKDPEFNPLEHEPTNFIRDYALLLSSQKSFVFKEQINPITEQYSTFSYFISFLGLNPTNILTHMKKIGYTEYFKNIVIAIFELAGFSLGIPFLVSALTYFLVYLTEFILKVIGKHMPSYDTIKKCLINNMQIAYKAITVTDFENLNFKENLEELKARYEESFFSKMKKKPDEIMYVFAEKSKFLQEEAWSLDFQDVTPKLII